MRLFRSEEHVGRWLKEQGYEPGRTITAGQLCELAHAWWGDRLAPDWRPRTRVESQAILDRLGLTGEFWQLAWLRRLCGRRPLLRTRSPGGPPLGSAPG